jgi:hypothetical protein
MGLIPRHFFVGRAIGRWVASLVRGRCYCKVGGATTRSVLLVDGIYLPAHIHMVSHC